MIFRKDNFVFGLVLGFIAPMIGFLFYKFFKFRSFSLEEMIGYLRDNPGLITVSIAVTAALLLVKEVRQTAIEVAP